MSFLGPVRTLTARKEIVLSAGVLGTPILLQLSGIGNKKDLKAAGVKTIVDNPSVGYNMSDHTSMVNTYLLTVPTRWTGFSAIQIF